MNEDREDEAKPLVWRWFFIDATADVRVRHATKTTEVGELAGDVRSGDGCGIRTRPGD